MIAVYKDPKGERVFRTCEGPSLKSQLQLTQCPMQNTDSTNDTIDSLKKRIQDLENIIAASKPEVCKIIITISKS